MFHTAKKSVTRTIAAAMSLILLLSVTTISFAIFMLASSLNDAEAVNVAGSMRMQSYRLAHDIQSESQDYSEHVELFEDSIYAESMQALEHWAVPDDIHQDYLALVDRWEGLRTLLKSNDRDQYLDLVAPFVSQIDEFVFKLQGFSEDKLITLASFGGAGLGGILLISILVVMFVRNQVVGPLRALVTASQQIQNRSFDVEVPVYRDNELGILTTTFNHMAKDLGKLYRGLEQAVDEKTRKLQHANQSLEVLYNSSQELTASRITQDNFQAILRHIVSLDGIKSVKLEIDEAGERNVMLVEGEMFDETEEACGCKELTLDGVHLGHLYWQAGLPCPDQALLDNFVQILSRAVYYNQAQRQAEHLILLEERATIARELHDSLAQALSYLKIQVTLLKRSVKGMPDEQAIERTNLIISELDTGLSAAYTQLRELLTTFRLTIKEGTFGQALQEMIATLDDRTNAKITLNNELSSVELDAHQQVHLLQLIREATINAIKHSESTYININCVANDGEVAVTIEDDGVGFDRHEEKVNHYGMSIMRERAARLNGKLNVTAMPDKGCTVQVMFQTNKETSIDSM